MSRYTKTFVHTSGRKLVFSNTAFAVECTSIAPDGQESMVPLTAFQVQTMYEQIAAKSDWSEVE